MPSLDDGSVTDRKALGNIMVDGCLVERLCHVLLSASLERRYYTLQAAARTIALHLLSIILRFDLLLSVFF